LADRRRGQVRLYSRSLRDITGEFPDVARALEAGPAGDFVLDGEIVAFDRRGISRFQLLQRERMGAVFVVFDCLERDGAGLFRRPLAERRRALEVLMRRRRGALMLARRLPQDGLSAYRIAQRRGWEGIIAKDDASPYEPGRRSSSWLKVKCRR